MLAAVAAVLFGSFVQIVVLFQLQLLFMLEYFHHELN